MLPPVALDSPLFLHSEEEDEITEISSDESLSSEPGGNSTVYIPISEDEQEAQAPPTKSRKRRHRRKERRRIQ